MQWPEDQAVVDAIKLLTEQEDISSVAGPSHHLKGSGADAALLPAGQTFPGLPC